MKTKLLFLLLLFTTVTLWASTPAETGMLDVTSSYLKNAKFDEGDMTAVSVHTYDYDIVGSNVAQLQAVNQWTIVSNGNARSGAQYAINSGLFLGGADYVVPTTDSEGNTAGGMLGILGVWGGQAQYTQNVTLPAGTYTLTYAIYNVGGTGSVTKNLFGFLANDGNEYLCTEKTFTVGRWTTISTTFMLTENASGKVSVGYNAAGAGSASQPHLFVDYVKIEKAEDAGGVATEITAPEIPGIDPRTWTGGTTTPLYVYNVDADAFVTYGMNWNTNAIATRLNDGDQSESPRHNTYITYSEGVLNMIDADYTDKFIGTNSAANDVWVDFTANKDWTVIANGTNTYNIAFGSSTGNKLDVSYKYGGHLTTTGGMGYTKWAFIPTTNVTNGSYAKYKAKKNLYDLYDALNKAGLASKYANAINAAAVIYNNAAASASNINNAARTLAKAVGADMPSGLDVSYIFTNADISGTKGISQWSTTDMAYNYGEYEKYHAAITLEQTQTGLPTGMYSVKFHSLIRLDNGDAAPQLTVTGAQAISAQVPVMNTLDWACNTNGNNGWANDGGKIIPNNMLSAAQGMTHQDAVAAVDYAPVDAGSLTLNVGITSGNQWFNMQGFSIEFTTISDYLAKMVADGQQCLTTNSGRLPAGIVSAMNTSIANAQKGATSATAAYAIGSGISNIIADIPAILESYAKIQELIDEASVYAVFDAAAVNDAIAAANTSLNSVTDHEDIDAVYNTMKDAFNEVIRTSTVDSANLTSLIVNPTLVADDAGVVPNGWTGNTSSWRWTQGTGNNVMECWNGTASDVNFDMYQTIKGLPAGVYQLGVDMMNSTNGEAGAELSGYECGLYAQTASSNAYVGINEDSDVLKTYSLYIYVGEDESLTIGVKNVASVTARWFACDNFTLTYRSLSDASINELIASIPNVKANGTLKANMQAAQNKLQANANGQNFGTLTSAIADVYASAANYGHLLQYINNDDRLTNCSEAAKTERAKLLQPVMEAYNNETLDGSMIAEKRIIEKSLAQALINVGDPLTPLIRNNSFEQGLTYWSLPTLGNDSGAKENNNATYTTSGCDGSRLFNTWSAGDKGGYPLTQDIGYLPAGTYKLSALVASSTGKVFLLANGLPNEGTACSDKTIFLNSDMTFTLTQESRVIIGVAGANNNGAYDGGNSSWYKADKFELVVTAAFPDINKDGRVTITDMGDLIDYLKKGSVDYQFAQIQELEDELLKVAPVRVIYQPSSMKGDFTNPASQWCYDRSKESAHFICFWEDGANFNVDEMLSVAERCWEIYTNELGFVKVGASSTDTYKIVMRVYNQSEWLASGSGEDMKVGTLNLCPWAVDSRGGATVAHEIGHTFQYLTNVDCGANNVHGFNYGLGDNGVGGNGFWEDCANWMAYKVYPGRQFTDGEYFNGYIPACHRNLMHEDNRYLNCFYQDFLCDKFGQDFIGRLWREAINPEDPVDAIMRLQGLNDSGFAELMYDIFARMCTWDTPSIREAAHHRIGAHQNYLQSKTIDGKEWFQVDTEHCPQNYGYNITELKVPAAGSTIKIDFRGLINEDGYRSVNSSMAGWRWGVVTLNDDGTTTYSRMQNSKEGSFQMTTGENASRMWLVVMGAPTRWWHHAWDGDVSNDEQWPYRVRMTGTRPLGTNHEYTAADFPQDYVRRDTTIVVKAELAYSGSNYSSVRVQYDIDAVCEALGITTAQAKAVLANQTTASAGAVRFAGVNQNGTLSYNTTTSTSSSTVFGHWFSTTGNICGYDNSAAIFAEMTPENYGCSVGQYPGRLTVGSEYVIRQAVTYNVSSTESYKAVFEVHLKVI